MGGAGCHLLVRWKSERSGLPVPGSPAFEWEWLESGHSGLLVPGFLQSGWKHSETAPLEQPAPEPPPGWQILCIPAAE